MLPHKILTRTKKNSSNELGTGFKLFRYNTQLNRTCNAEATRREKGQDNRDENYAIMHLTYLFLLSCSVKIN